MAFRIVRGIKLKRTLWDFVEESRFYHILVVWLVVILMFGSCYYILSSYYPGNEIHYSKTGLPVVGKYALFNSIYFSFITATSTGFGDILPIGFSKVLALFEVIIGLLLFGAMISKLVSLKEETILEEVYSISFDEQLNRLRSSLHLYRSDINRVIDKIETGKITPREVSDIWIKLTSFDIALNRIYKIMCMPPRHDERDSFYKKIDELNLELIVRSISFSLVKTVELVNVLNAKHTAWRSELMLEHLVSILDSARSINEYFTQTEINKKVFEKLHETNGYLEELRAALEGAEKV